MKLNQEKAATTGCLKWNFEIYNLCLTLSLSSHWHFPKKIDIEFFFSSCTQCAVFSCAIDAAQLVWCILCFNLKTFPGWVIFAQKL